LKNYFKKHPWKIIENKFTPEYNQVSESIFSIGNGRMGQRANFAETYNGDTLQGSYLAGIYYPDKTKVGWWKNGYPEYFAKVLNSVNWIGIKLKVNDHTIDLSRLEVIDFYRELDMKNGILKRRSIVKVDKKTSIQIESERFYSLQQKDLSFLHYSVKNLGQKCKVEITSFLQADVWNHDTNYDESFWQFDKSNIKDKVYWIQSTTRKTEFTVVAAQKNVVMQNGRNIKDKTYKKGEQNIGLTYKSVLKPEESIELIKHTAICSSFYYDKKNLKKTTLNRIKKSIKKGYDVLISDHSKAWNEKWKTMDVLIEGDVAAQQGIRYNIFQLHQTYTGEDSRLNIGPKGFTGEKYGGSTYWDTEAYCLPFYMGTSTQSVCKNLLKYRHNHLPKAIENAQKLGFVNGAALYPMVTMNGEECHNEWEITFEEIHRNGAIAYAIYDYIRYFGDDGYLAEYGIDVLTGISRFWAQRVNWSTDKNAYVILGVTGPNEYENNIDNNWYTNYMAKWCLIYAYDCYNLLIESNSLFPNDMIAKLNLSKKEVESWNDIASQIYFPTSRKHGIFLQQDGFLDKEQVLVADLKNEERPLNQKWSWDRILRSPYIKQADVLQGMYFFEEKFSKKSLENNFNYYEPRTVHESSLSPCVHSILAASLGKMDKAYEMYLRTSRLDLDNYNNDTEDGLHITSMAGSWLSVIKGFAGMKIQNNLLSFHPFLPEKWKSYSFKIKHQGQSIKIKVNGEEIALENESKNDKIVKIFNKRKTIAAFGSITVNHN
tara:strand:- start:1055 stop:3361 length:2307 start_codon:yes stop_codon:yes gene_type:complete